MLKAQGLDYEANGDGEAVLLIHGGHVADGFLPLMSEASLADGYRLIRYRRRGYAGSDPLSGGFSAATSKNIRYLRCRNCNTRELHDISDGARGLDQVR